MIEEKNIFAQNSRANPKEALINLIDMMIRYNVADFSGVNAALRVSENIYVTQRKIEEKYSLHLKTEDIFTVDINGSIIEGNADKLSFEGDLFLDIFKNFSDYNFIMLANSFYSMLASSLKLPLTGSTEAANYYNIKNIPVISENSPLLSLNEKNIILNSFSELNKRNEAPVVILPFHGIIAAGKNTNDVFSLFNAVERNSKHTVYTNLLQTSVFVSDLLKKVNESVITSEHDLKSQINPEASSETSQVFQEEKIEINEPDLENKSGPVTVEEKAYRVDISAKIFTAEDMNEILKDSAIKKIIISEGVKVTEFAEIQADALGIELIKE